MGIKGKSKTLISKKESNHYAMFADFCKESKWICREKMISAGLPEEFSSIVTDDNSQILSLSVAVAGNHKGFTDP